MVYSTRQRDAVRDALSASDRPLTAQEIWKRARKKKAGLGLATVYRSLKSLAEEGQAVLVEIPGSAPHYEWQHGHHHHHFLCEQCQRVFELEGCVHEVVELAPKKFKVKRHEIILYGSCEDCLAK